MPAIVEKMDDGYIATYHLSLYHSVEQVWATLTQNDRLKKWMSNLEVVDLRKGGTMQFNMNDGTGSSFNITILDLEEQSYLQYEWADGWVQFELSPNDDGCLLRLKEYIPILSDHTPKDLAGWHICLDLFSAVLKGQHMDFPKKEWEKRYKEYQRIINQI